MHDPSNMWWNPQMAFVHRPSSHRWNTDKAAELPWGWELRSRTPLPKTTTRGTTTWARQVLQTNPRVKFKQKAVHQAGDGSIYFTAAHGNRVNSHVVSESSAFLSSNSRVTKFKGTSPFRHNLVRVNWTCKPTAASQLLQARIVHAHLKKKKTKEKKGEKPHHFYSMLMQCYSNNHCSLCSTYTLNWNKHNLVLFHIKYVTILHLECICSSMWCVNW